MHATQPAAARVLVRERVLSAGPMRAQVVLVVVAFGFASTGATSPGGSAPGSGPQLARRCAVRPPLYRIDLTSTERAPGARGVARLRPQPTPFGLPVTVDGRLVLEVEVSAEGLPTPANLGPYATYAAWVATPDLDEMVRLGPLTDGLAKGHVAWNKFLVFVSAEPSTIGERWTGPIVLRGMSASGYMQNFSAHPLFNGGVPPC
jgi:hypothetical protein